MTTNLTKVCSKKFPEKRWEPELSPGGEESVCGLKGQNPTRGASEEWHGEAMHGAWSESAHISSISMSCSIRTLLRLPYILGPSKRPSSHFITDKNRLYEYKLLHFAKMQCIATNTGLIGQLFLCLESIQVSFPFPETAQGLEMGEGFISWVLPWCGKKNNTPKLTNRKPPCLGMSTICSFLVLGC